MKLSTRLLIAFAAAVFAFLAFLAAKAANSDGRITHCYVTWHVSFGPVKGFWSVHGFVPWRADQNLGYFPTIEEVAAVAKIHNCELR